MLKFMLDTDICIFTIKNRPQETRDVQAARWANVH